MKGQLVDMDVTAMGLWVVRIGRNFAHLLVQTLNEKLKAGTAKELTEAPQSDRNLRTTTSC